MRREVDIRTFPVLAGLITHDTGVSAGERLVPVPGIGITSSCPLARWLQKHAQ